MTDQTFATSVILYDIGKNSQMFKIMVCTSNEMSYGHSLQNGFDSELRVLQLYLYL